MTKVEKQLQELGKQTAKLMITLTKQRANKQFRCICGKMHRIKDCEAIQTHWYTPPRGCMEGDYWNRGDLHVVCPDTGERNRMYFSNYDVDWEHRGDYLENAEKQFIDRYGPLFKKVTEEHEHGDGRRGHNNTYVDEHHEKFGLKVASRNYKKNK